MLSAELSTRLTPTIFRLMMSWMLVFTVSNNNTILSLYIQVSKYVNVASFAITLLLVVDRISTACPQCTNHVAEVTGSSCVLSAKTYRFCRCSRLFKDCGCLGRPAQTQCEYVVNNQW